MFLLVCNGIYDDSDHSNMSNDLWRLQDDQENNRDTLVDYVDSDDTVENHGKVIDVDIDVDVDVDVDVGGDGSVANKAYYWRWYIKYA